MSRAGKHCHLKMFPRTFSMHLLHESSKFVLVNYGAALILLFYGAAYSVLHASIHAAMFVQTYIITLDEDEVSQCNSNDSMSSTLSICKM